MRYMTASLLCFSVLIILACTDKPKPRYPHFFESPGLKEDAVSKPVPPSAPPKDVHPELKNDPIFASYLKHHDRSISVKWTKPFCKPLVCRIKVNSSGYLTEVEIEKSSSSQTDDRTALDILHSTHFLFLPPPSKEETFLVTFANFPNATVDRVRTKERLDSNPTQQ